MIKYTVRRVLPHEFPKYRKHLKSLDAVSRNMRFGVTTTDETIDKLCDKFEEDYSNNILFAVEDYNLDFIGIGHISTHGEMELAFSVLKDYQGMGIGSALMARCIQWCRTHNILKGNMVCLSTNTIIKRLCTKHGIKMQTEYGESMAEIELDSPSITTYVNEATATNLGAADYIGKRFTRPWTFTH